MSAAAIRYPGGVEAEVQALRAALDAENVRAMKAEERVLELEDLAAQLRRRLALRQTHDDEMTVRAHRAEKRCRQLEAGRTGARPAVRAERPEAPLERGLQPPESREAPKPLARAGAVLDARPEEGRA